jgi:hypothetical protein
LHRPSRTQDDAEHDDEVEAEQDEPVGHEIDQQARESTDGSMRATVNSISGLW